MFQQFLVKSDRRLHHKPLHVPVCKENIREVCVVVEIVIGDDDCSGAGVRSVDGAAMGSVQTILPACRRRKLYHTAVGE